MLKASPIYPPILVFNYKLCPEGDQHVYIGETARNLYSRGKEHMANAQSRNREAFMKKHNLEKHHGADEDFCAKVTGSFKDCLTRQVSEGVYLRKSPHSVLNSKAEWHQPALWRVRNEIIFK